MEIKDIEMKNVHVSTLNTRKDLGAGEEDAGLDDLANSIKEKGLLNPVTVMKRKDSSFELIAGQRRFLACQKLGWTTIPAIIREDLNETDATILSLIENVQRADMNPIDKARAYQKIYEKYADYDKVAKEVGVSIATIKRYLELLKLSESIQKTVSTSGGFVGISTLSKLAETFTSADEQETALNEISGFNQKTQLEILKRSNGDIGNLLKLKEQALAGEFDVVMCRDGLCPLMSENLKDRIKRTGKNKKDGSLIELNELNQN